MFADGRGGNGSHTACKKSDRTASVPASCRSSFSQHMREKCPTWCTFCLLCLTLRHLKISSVTLWFAVDSCKLWRWKWSNLTISQEIALTLTLKLSCTSVLLTWCSPAPGVDCNIAPLIVESSINASSRETLTAPVWCITAPERASEGAQQWVAAALHVVRASTKATPHFYAFHGSRRNKGCCSLMHLSAGLDTPVY